MRSVDALCFCTHKQIDNDKQREGGREAGRQAGRQAGREEGRERESARKREGRGE
jgi:hypothetical protein